MADSVSEDELHRRVQDRFMEVFGDRILRHEKNMEAFSKKLIEILEKMAITQNEMKHGTERFERTETAIDKLLERLKAVEDVNHAHDKALVKITLIIGAITFVATVATSVIVSMIVQGVVGA